MSKNIDLSSIDLSRVPRMYTMYFDHTMTLEEQLEKLSQEFEGFVFEELHYGDIWFHAIDKGDIFPKETREMTDSEYYQFLSRIKEIFVLMGNSGALVAMDQAQNEYRRKGLVMSNDQDDYFSEDVEKMLGFEFCD